MNTERLLALYDRVTDAPDAVRRLRRFILDLAVRGRLVEQNPADEPASELLKRLAAEKARMLKAGTIRKPRNLTNGETLTKPFEIPLSWHWCRLDSIGAIVGGGTPSSAVNENFTEPGKGVSWLTPADLGGHSQRYIERGSRDLSEKGLNSSSAILMPAGTVLFTSRAPIGYVAIASNPVSTNQGFKSIVPYLGESSRFIAIAMLAFAPEINAKAPGTTFKEVSGKIVSGISFPLPPLAEQHRIVAKVDKLIALCDRLEAARAAREQRRDQLTAAGLARLSAPGPDASTFRAHAHFAVDRLPVLTARSDQVARLRRTILNLAVRGRLVQQDPNDEPASEQLSRISRAKSAVKARKGSRGKSSSVVTKAEIEQLPIGWHLVRLDDLAVSMRYGTSVKCDYDEALTPVLRIPNVSSGQVNLDDLKFGPLNEGDREALALMAGDLLIIRSNGSLKIVGRSAVVVPDAEGMSFAGYLVRFRTLNEQLNTRYVWLALNSDAVREQIERPIRSAVGLKNINLAEFGDLSFWLPPLAEQHRIVAKVDELMALGNRLEASLSAADTSRQRLLESLIHEALDGTA